LISRKQRDERSIDAVTVARCAQLFISHYWSARTHRQTLAIASSAACLLMFTRRADVRPKVGWKPSGVSKNTHLSAKPFVAGHHAAGDRATRSHEPRWRYATFLAGLLSELRA